MTRTASRPSSGGTGVGDPFLDTLNEIPYEAFVRVFEFSRDVTEAGSQSSGEHLASFLNRRNSQSHGFQIGPAVDDQSLRFEIEFQVAFAPPDIQLHSPTIGGIGQSHAACGIFSHQIQTVVFVGRPRKLLQLLAAPRRALFESD